MMNTPIPHTPTQLRQALLNIGIKSGQVVMLHSAVKSIGHIMGGPNTLLHVLLDVLGQQGTLMMYAGWQDIPDFILELPPEERQIYYAEHPPFDVNTSRAVRDNSILAEFFRTMPHVRRSANPEASMIARGVKADELTQNHPLNYGYGASSPLARLITLRGKVLMLGAPLDTVTLLHHAEYQARIKHKNVIHYQCPIQQNGATVWVDVEDYDTGEHHADYTFEQIVHDYIQRHDISQQFIGNAPSYLFDAFDLNQFAVHWLEERFA